MRPFQRLNPPDWLRDNAEDWGQEYARRKQENPGYRFQWKSIDNQRVNQRLLPILEQQTQRHCSYCDSFPLRRPDNTIDHFCPKGDERFYYLVYAWENLYLACGNCQDAKGEQFHDLLLRPDDPDFSFERYFIYNYSTRQIEPNPDALDTDIQRAEKTFKIFGFNDEAQKILRRHALERFEGMAPDERVLDDFPFRFMFLL